MPHPQETGDAPHTNEAYAQFLMQGPALDVSDELYNHPGDMQSLNKLQALGQDFIAHKRDELISEFGNQGKSAQVESFYQKESGRLLNKEHQLANQFHQNSEQLNKSAKQLDVGTDCNQATQFQQKVEGQIHKTHTQSEKGKDDIQYQQEALSSDMNHRVSQGKQDAQKNLVLREGWLKTNGLHKDK